MQFVRAKGPLAACVLIFACGMPGLAPADSAASPNGALRLASTGTVIDDTVITTKIKAAYVQDPLVSTLDIEVDTERGVVRLGGFANSEAEKERAATLARSVDGVVEVRNDIQVKPTPVR